MKNLQLLNKLIKQESEALSREILSPVVHGSPIVVRVNGAALYLRVNPKKFHGWGVFKYDGNHKSATFIKEPSMQQKRLYLENFPKIRLIICSHNEKMTIGSKLYNDGRYGFDATSIFFAENISLFDVVDVRDCGGRFYYETHARGHSSYVDVVKNAFAEETSPDKVNTWEPFLTAYRFAYNELIKTKELTIEQRVKQAIHRAGGKYSGFTDRGDTLTVQFVVDGEIFTPTVNSKTLMLENAGICLSGGDRAFDLQSFVHIARQGIREDEIVRGDYLISYGDRSNEYRR